MLQSVLVRSDSNGNMHSVSWQRHVVLILPVRKVSNGSEHSNSGRDVKWNQMLSPERLP